MTVTQMTHYCMLFFLVHDNFIYIYYVEQVKYLLSMVQLLTSLRSMFSTQLLVQSRIFSCTFLYLFIYFILLVYFIFYNPYNLYFLVYILR